MESAARVVPEEFVLAPGIDSHPMARSHRRYGVHLCPLTEGCRVARLNAVVVDDWSHAAGRPCAMDLRSRPAHPQARAEAPEPESDLHVL